MFSHAVRAGALQTRRGTSYSREILQSIIGVREIRGMAKTKSSRKVPGGDRGTRTWRLKEALAERRSFFPRI